MAVLLATWFLIFMFYSVAGWAMEVIVTLLQNRRLINRGFLVGPICPIYGCGALLILFLLQDTHDVLAAFCVAMVGGATLEYIVSVIMEKLFRVRWWDYSKHAFNLNGRICLRSTLAFGFLGVLINFLVTPALLSLLYEIPGILRIISASILLLALLIDIATSLWLVLGVRVTVGVVQSDATEEITERVREILMNKSRLNRRLIKAFPSQTAENQRKKQSNNAPNDKRTKSSS